MSQPISVQDTLTNDYLFLLFAIFIDKVSVLFYFQSLSVLMTLRMWSRWGVTRSLKAC